MDYSRALQIIKSPDKIKVFHNHKSIWIKNIDKLTQTADVASSPQDNESLTVSLNELHE